MIKLFHRTKAVGGILFLSTCVLLTCSGCVGTLAQLIYVVKGHDVPAAYNGLVGKRTAVICVSDASAYGPDTLTDTMSRALGLKLAAGVKRIEVIPHATIESWIDEHGWDEQDFGALGKGVKAERVVAVEMGSYSIHEGQTIYKGRADVTVTVYELDGQNAPQVAYVYGPQEYSFPKNGRPSIQSNDRQFEAFFLSRLTQNITDQFTKHDRYESFAEDAMLGE